MRKNTSCRNEVKNPIVTFVKSYASLLGAAMMLLISGQPSHAGSSGFEILYTDSQAAILMADATSGSPTLLAQGQKLVQPLGIAMGLGSELFITDTGCGGVIALNLKNGKQRLLASGGILGLPFGIAVEQSGSL